MKILKTLKKKHKNISKEIFENFLCLVKVLIPSSVCCYDSHGLKRILWIFVE